MASFGDGLAVEPDLIRAARDATDQALAPLAGEAPDLVCVFVCAEDPDDVAAAAEVVLEESDAGVLLGCSAGGVIGASRGVEMLPSVSVWAAQLPGVNLSGFYLDAIHGTDSIAVVGMPDIEADAEVAVLLADPYTFPADGFIEKSNELLPGLPIVGGLATGLTGEGSTRLILDDEVYDRGAVGVVINGTLGSDVAVRTLVSQGCRPIGPTLAVTKAVDNVLLELAGMPALAKLEQILEDLPPSDQLLVQQGLHIGITIDEYGEHHERGDFLVRQVIGADSVNDAVVIGDVVEVGQTVRFHVRDAHTAEEDLRQMLAAFREQAGIDPVEGALLFSCNGRGANLFATADHDVLAVQEGLKTRGVAGFFAAGEIGPVGGRNHVHGFTASILAFGTPTGRPALGESHD
ncbi:histidine kinase [Carbonactinospora thermoautotrophica]|uniref:Histidine kinase n=1 Tax=Carbonactinospora thermoautotrophica TaxID=1469144 RepID=A0A132NFH2_9ACTN|nr:FIST N-terminal domain-containing protein [Carbonactinospora thermoautotrophica]KWW99208.1 hypothetical protein LI90_842 [Carbonactinospora thermoautotrophica]KWX05018.1 histidine kinase [Carbonactinospora thermoautotrophica]KWX08402.1 histidine kinase [Carbonactinospora thermoautotrophica]MCX9191590.1 histidine kinase [Carbonactinospora thermoautotrophica]